MIGNFILSETTMLSLSYNLKCYLSIVFLSGAVTDIESVVYSTISFLGLTAKGTYKCLARVIVT